MFLSRRVRAGASFGLRTFSRKHQSVQSSKQGLSTAALLSIGGGSVAIGGFTYLAYKGHQDFEKEVDEQYEGVQLVDEETVARRVKQSFTYFGGAFAANAALMFLFCRFKKLVQINEFKTFFAAIFFYEVTEHISIEKHPVLKHLLFGAFITSVALTLTPSLVEFRRHIVKDALLISGVSIASISMLAYNYPSKEFLSWGSPIAVFCGSCLGVMLLFKMYPRAPSISSSWLFAGIALFNMFLSYDIKKMLHNAATEESFDPLNEGMGMMVAAAELIEDLIEIMGESEDLDDDLGDELCDDLLDIDDSD